jgi:diguanylate cyclase (GGDEF)-like protein
MVKKSKLTLEDLMDLRGDLETVDDDTLSDLVEQFIDLKKSSANQEQKLNQMVENSHIDPLTDLVTFRVLEKELHRSLSIATRYNRSSALVLIDIEDFDTIQEHFGKDVSDQVLCHIANLLRQNTRTHDVISRTDGCEFGVLLNEIASPKDTEARADMLSSLIVNTPCVVGAHAVHLSVTIGVCHFDADYKDVGIILEEAESDRQSRLSNKA